VRREGSREAANGRGEGAAVPKWEPFGYTPVFFAKSAQTIEKKRDDLPVAAKNGKEEQKSERWEGVVCPSPGSLYEHQNREVAGEAVWKRVKEKELGKRGQARTVRNGIRNTQTV